MTQPVPLNEIKVPDIHQDTFSRTVQGFWIYLMTDCVIFATLFATYAVLHKSTFGGPSTRELFSLPLPFAETMVLLASSFACGLGTLAAQKSIKSHMIFWLAVAFILGSTFVYLELHEFGEFIRKGHTWRQSAFLSSFFTLVGTHGFHVSIGLLWLVVLLGQFFVKGITATTFRRLVCFNMFWHFLDFVWIFIFSFVYLMGVI